MKLASDYQSALDRAVAAATELKMVIVIVHWGERSGYGVAMLKSLMELYKPSDKPANIVTFVDADGNVTESDWIKAKLQEVAA